MFCCFGDKINKSFIVNSIDGHTDSFVKYSHFPSKHSRYHFNVCQYLFVMITKDKEGRCSAGNYIRPYIKQVWVTLWKTPFFYYCNKYYRYITKPMLASSPNTQKDWLKCQVNSEEDFSYHCVNWSPITCYSRCGRGMYRGPHSNG